MKKKILSLCLILVLLLSLFTACENQFDNKKESDVKQTNISKQQYEGQGNYIQDNNEEENSNYIVETGHYTSKEDVALYIYTYNKLPSNYITKSEAKNLGWEAKEGNLWHVAEGKSIGGDKFSNREGKLPDAKGRQWYECDIDYNGGYRDEKRIVYSNDGLIYYTEDHYSTFILLYGE